VAAKKSAKPAAAKSLTANPAKRAAAAKPAATGKPSLLDRTASYEIAADAAGLARVPAGMASSPRAAALLGIGYPHVLMTTDEAMPKLASYADYKRRYDGKNIVPRALLPVMYAVSRAPLDPAELDKAVANPVTDATVEDAAEEALTDRRPWLIFVMEGLFGSTATARAFAAALTAADPDDLAGGRYEDYGSGTIPMLGWVLWRVPAKVRTEVRAALAKVLARLRAEDKVWRVGKAIDLVVGGRAVVERSGARFGNQPNGYLHLGQLPFADDDPPWVAERVAERLKVLRPADRETFDIQLAVAGGPAALATLRANVDRFKKHPAHPAEDQLALVV
jgi:hypothetical protein